MPPGFCRERERFLEFLKKVLVTGGSGFIGCNFLRLMVSERPGTKWVNLDALTYAGRPENTENFAEAENYRFATSKGATSTPTWR